MDEKTAADRVMRAFSKEADKHGWKPGDAKTLRLLLTMLAASLAEHPDPQSAVTLIVPLLRDMAGTVRQAKASH